MNRTGYLVATLMLGALPVASMAQTETVRPDLTGEIPAESPRDVPMPGEADVTDKGDPNWYVGMNYAGFDFEIPAGTVVERGSSFVGKYPDGSFGVSMSNTARRAPNQKVAFELCRQLATSLHLPDPKVEKVKYGKASGAKATGRLEGQDVTVLALPYGDQEVTTVILATPMRSDWVDHFLATLKR